MRWSLVLSGGGARGLAHIGIIRELERRGVPRPSFIAGTSMGALLGAMYASGWDGARLEEYARGFELRDFLENPAFKLPDMMLSRLVQAGSAISSLLRGRSLDSGARARAELARIFGNTRIEDLPIPFACTATDLISGMPVVFDSGSLVDALRASMSFPGVFAPVLRDGMILVDGGVLDNLPCDVAKARKVGRILASDVSPFEPATPESLTNGIALMFRCFDVASSHAQKEADSMADLTLYSTDGRSPFQFEDAGAIIELGQRSASLAAADLDSFFASAPIRAAKRVAEALGFSRSRRRRAPGNREPSDQRA